MPANIAFNPLLVTTAAGTFSTTTDGFVQGTMMDDPAIRNSLAGGVLAAAETLPMWGGVAIFENIPGVANAPAVPMGPTVGRAANNAAVAGFSVFNQASNWVTSPQSEAPSAGNGMTIPFFRLGSGARIAVACDAGLAALEGSGTNQQVSWDFNNQRLTPFDSSTATITITGLTWANTLGGQLIATVANWTGAFQPAAGDLVNISGATNTGTGGATAVNTNFVVVSSTSTGAVLAAPAAAGVFGTLAGSPVFNFGVGALNVKVLQVSLGNSRTISYDSVNNLVHWQNSGNCALILL